MIEDNRVAAKPAERFLFLDALRGLAAIGIMLHHLERYGPLPGLAAEILPPWVILAMRYGWMAVELFMVISGFAIAYSLRKSSLSARVTGNFLLRRIVRLGIPYWGLLLLALGLDVLMRGVLAMPSPIDDPPTLLQTISHLFFLHKVLGYDSFSTGLWFICIEVQFSLVFVLLLWFAQRLFGKRAGGEGPSTASGLLVVFLPLAMYSLFVSRSFGGNDNYVTYFFAMFFMGSMVWWALSDAVPRWAFWAYLVAFAAQIAWRPSLEMSLTAGFGAMVYVVGRLGGLGNWLSYRPLQYLGRISYSLFLVHYPVQHLVCCIGYRFTGDRPGAAVLWMGLAILCSLATAHVFYAAVESPAIRWAARLKPATTHR